jgi:hypothetical protein
MKGILGLTEVRFYLVLHRPPFLLIHPSPVFMVLRFSPSKFEISISPISKTDFNFIIPELKTMT